MFRLNEINKVLTIRSKVSKEDRRKILFQNFTFLQLNIAIYFYNVSENSLHHFRVSCS